MNKWVIAMMVLLVLFVLGLMASASASPTAPGKIFTFLVSTPSPMSGNFQIAEYVDGAESAAMQATLVAGQGEMMELSHQATMVSLSLEQAANAVARTTADYHQSQLMELSYQATAVSLNMTQAAATQQYIADQTQAVWNAAATAQSQAATATNSAYLFSVTQTAQIQAIQDGQATQSAHLKATQVAYSLTATPWAAIQSDIVRMRNEYQRRALWDEFVVTPLKLILVALVVLLPILGAVLAYQRLMPVLELRLRTISRFGHRPLLLVDGMVVDQDPYYRPGTLDISFQEHPIQISRDVSVQVEIIGPTELSVTDWITEAEQKLQCNGRTAQP
jgi:hypothetical protein